MVHRKEANGGGGESVLKAQSTTKDYIRAEEDFHKEI